LKLNP